MKIDDTLVTDMLFKKKNAYQILLKLFARLFKVWYIDCLDHSKTHTT